jgi:hypothetical protein
MMGALLPLAFVGSVPGSARGEYWNRMSRADYFLLNARPALGSLIATPLVERWATRILATRRAGE